MNDSYNEKFDIVIDNPDYFNIMGIRTCFPIKQKSIELMESHDAQISHFGRITIPVLTVQSLRILK